jgi:hypothetical protein
MKMGTSGCVQEMKTRLAEWWEVGDWSSLISANKKRLVRVKVAKVCGFDTSTFKNNKQVRALLIEAEEKLRQRGILRACDDDTSADRDEAFDVLEKRLEALEQAITERKTILDEVSGKAADYQHHLVALLKK